jgi:hypothetical protein
MLCYCTEMNCDVCSCLRYCSGIEIWINKMCTVLACALVDKRIDTAVVFAACGIYVCLLQKLFRGLVYI